MWSRLVPATQKSNKEMAAVTVQVKVNWLEFRIIVLLETVVGIKLMHKCVVYNTTNDR